MMVLGGEAFGGGGGEVIRSGHESGTLLNGISDLIKSAFHPNEG